MAVSRFQQPTQKYIHQVIYPEFYTSNSTNYEDSNFKYKFSLNTIDGIIHQSIASPRIINGLGAYNPNPILKSEVSNKFKPDITEITEVPELLKHYRVDVEEINGDGSSAKYDKYIAIKANKEDFDIDDYTLNSDTSKCLTDWESTREVTLDDEGTLRGISGIIGWEEINTIPISYQAIRSYLYEIKLVVTKPNGDKYHYFLKNENPYYADTTKIGFDHTNSDLIDLSKWVLAFPALPKNINDGEWELRAYTPAGGSYTELSSTLHSNFLEINDRYEIYTYTWPQGDNGQTSKSYHFEIVDECRIDYAQLAWENEVGGYDYYTLTKNKTKGISVDKSYYQKNKYEQGYNGNYNRIGNDEYSRGTTSYYNEKTIKYDLWTDWLTEQEIIDIEPLWSSNDVYLRLNDKWYPIIITNQDVRITSDEKELRNYKITVELSNKKYN